MADSDDDFSTVQENIPKTSKLSKKKKNKENVKKPHTSTQKDIPEPITARGGRPARKAAEELQFQRELEEALRISSTDVSSSSAEIVPVNGGAEGVKVKSDLVERAVDEILVVSDSSQDSVDQHESAQHGVNSVKTVEVNDEEDSNNGIVKKTKRRYQVIDSDDEFEAEISSKTVAVKPSDKQAVNSTSDASKKRKVEESWVVSGSKKTLKTDEIKTTLRRTVKPKKYGGNSSESENFSEDDDANDEEESDEEFAPVKAKRKTPAKKATVKETLLKKPHKSPPSLISRDSILSPKKPLGIHNPIPSPAIPLPKSKNMFQHKSPIKLAINPKSPVPSPPASKPAMKLKSLTPGPTHSISSLLKQFHNQTKSTPPIMEQKARNIPHSPATPSTPVQRKLPCWTPPAKIGTPVSKSSTPGQSPSIGLRVGLSRNFKSKPLHSGVKYP